MNKLEDSILKLMAAGGHTVVMQNAGIFRFPSSYRFETHSHAAYEIIYVNAGRGIMGIGEEYVPFKPGICVIVNPYAPHCFIVDSQKTCKITQVEMAVFSQPGACGGISFLENRTAYYRIGNCEPVNRLLENICCLNRLRREDSYAKAQMDFAMAQLYAGLSYYIDEQKEEPAAGGDKVGRLIRYINENLEGELNIEELSGRFGVSSRYVRKYFLQQMGMNCNEYITILRIGRAKDLLCEPAHSITDVALMAGFNSSQYFCRIFKQRVGMTPVEYRRMWREGGMEAVSE